MWPIFSRLLRSPTASTRLHCFHCQLAMSASQSIEVEFDGSLRQVCCHGCAAVLNTVQQNGLLAQYRAARHG